MRSILPRFALTSLLACLSAIVAGPATAEADAKSETTYYTVEIVLFEHMDPEAGKAERWRPEVIVPRLKNATAFDPAGAADPNDDPDADLGDDPGTDLAAGRLRELPEGFEKLPLSQSRLTQAVAKLTNSNDYRVIKHLIWRQPALAPKKAIPLRIHAGEPMIVRMPVTGLGYEFPFGPEPADGQNSPADKAPPKPQAASGRGGDGQGVGGQGGEIQAPESGTRTTTAGADRAMTAPPFSRGLLGPRVRDVQVYPIDGTLKLVVSRFLHIHTNLYYTTPVEWLDEEGSETGNTASPVGEPVESVEAAGMRTRPRIARGPNGQAMLSYPFRQERRMRSGNLHYLDHPVLGLLVLATPWEKPEGEEPEQ